MQYVYRWRSIRILYLTMFFDSFSFSVVLSSIWPYLQKVDTSTELSPVYAGWANIGFQLAGIAIDFAMGFWINKRGSKEPLIVSLFFFGFGNLLYAYAQSCGLSAVAMVIASRTIIGLSTGIDVVSRSATSDATSLKERTSAIANMSIAQGAGFTFGPALQLLSMPLGDKGIYIECIKLHLNVYTAPAIISIFIAILNGALIALCYREYRIDIYKDQDEDLYIDNYKRYMNGGIKSYSCWDKQAVIVILFLYFVGQNAFAFQETILTPLSMDQFAWTREETTLYLGLIFFAAGIIAIATFACTDMLVKRIDDRKILLLGFLFMFLGFLLYLPWGNNTPQIKFSVPTNLKPINNSTLPTAYLVGCPELYTWCHLLPRLQLAQVVVGMVFLSIGYPLVMVITTTMYSKVLGPLPQGFMQSWFSAVGGMARSTGPALVSYMYVSFGPRWTFGGADALILITMLALCVGYKTLVPYHKYIVKKKYMISSTSTVESNLDELTDDKQTLTAIYTKMEYIDYITTV